MGRNYDIISAYCKGIYLVGPGNFWFVEGEKLGDDRRWPYRLYTFILIALYLMLTILEILAVFFGDFPEKEAGDAFTLAVTHVIVMMKIFTVISNKEIIRNINKNMIEHCKKYETPLVMENMYRTVKINVTVYVLIVFVSLACFIIEAIKKSFEGSNFSTVTTYYPSYYDTSLTANVFGFFLTLVVIMMMLTMVISVDSYTMTNLIMLKYKFITLRGYFEKLWDKFDKTSNSGNLYKAAENLTNGFLEGIIMHNQLLKLVQDVHAAFGIVLASQLMLSTGSAVFILLQIALSKQITIINVTKLALFFAAVIILLGLFLCNAGEITYQASQLSNAIFYCGWHLCPILPPPHRNLRQLVLHACTQAQCPPVMKAFKMIELTYATFIQVLRGSYSLFALIYTRNK
ncbi:uncharacterized protein LOC131846544 [Achroia grisella]|uniref:uncharacterized protein LOC131846544 n=1 Tax=Achroia grisella TaxID=688607 RepID=UPI0027D252E5|nr:uncharacterized protein LOC131846544 [Achroia grisella]